MKEKPYDYINPFNQVFKKKWNLERIKIVIEVFVTCAKVSCVFCMANDEFKCVHD